MASCYRHPASHAARFNVSNKQIQSAFMQLLPPRKYASLLVMAPFLFFMFAPPMRSGHFSVAAAPHSKDNLRYFLALDCCVVSTQCSHAPHSPFGRFCCHPFSIFSSAVCSAPSAYFSMPRVRSRMSCRSGSSRGRATCQPSSTSSDPLSKVLDFCLDNYPVTRSDRGRGRG